MTLDPYIEAWELRELVRKREIRPREVAEVFLARIEKLDPALHAFITVTPERALDDAARLEKLKPADARRLPLYGVAYSLKDLVWTKDIRTTFGSKNYEHWRAPADAELAVRLRESGGILLGKTATSEFGTRPTVEGGLCPPVQNPWKRGHTAGGSSGGTAAAVAAGMHPVAQGSDGGGSIRIPAACCGLVGIKPSRGRITMAPQAGEGWAGFSTSGPIARTVRDAALMLDVMAGPSMGDPYAAWPPAGPFIEAARPTRKKLRLAAIAESALGRVDPEMRTAFESACRTMRSLGHRVETLKLDPGARLKPFAQIIVCACVSALEISNFEVMDEVARGTYEYGKTFSAADYVRNMTQMHNAAREVVKELAPYDALLTPTLTRPAVKLGTLPASPETAGDDIYAWIPFTFPFNVTGQPAISAPNGFSRDGLPLALQIVGRPYDEAGIIALAAQWEKARPWKDNRPPVD